MGAATSASSSVCPSGRCALDRIRDPWLRALSILLVLIAGLYLAGMVWSLLVQLADVLLLFFFGWLVAFMLEPAVAFVQERQGLRRATAVALVYSAVVAVLGGIGVWLIPAVVNQLALIAQRWPTYVDNLTYYATLLHQEAAAHGINLHSGWWNGYEDFLQRFANLGPPLLSNAISFARGATALVMDLVIILVLSVYLLLDSGRITHGIIRAVPAQMRDDVVYFMESVRRAFGGFLRGQLLLGMLYGLGTALVMTLAGLDFSLLASVFAALAMLVPFLGQVLAVLPPATIALLVHPDRVWWVLALLIVLQVLLLNVVSPRVMSRTVGVHPLLVFVAVLVGAKIAGLWGALFGVPITGVVVAMITFYRLTVEERRSRAAALTNGGAGTATPAQGDPVTEAVPTRPPLNLPT